MAKYTKQDILSIAQMMNHAKGQGRPFALLTGAGCSVTAKIPTAPQLLDEINKSGLGESIRQSLGTDNLRNKRYGEVMAYLNPEERKEIIGPFLKDAQVNWGNLALAGLMKEEFIGRVLTFNFDPVHAKACGIVGHYPAIYDFSQVPDAKGDFSYIAPSAILHLHGQGTSLTMMNTEADTKDHAQKLQPLFTDTLHRFDVIVIGYSGNADEAFDTFKSARSNRRITWCSFENTPVAHVKSLIDECGKMGQHFEEVDFDEFMIELATELRCFPALFTETANHLLSEIAHVVEPPKSLKGAVGLLTVVRDKLSAWNQSENSVEAKLRSALLRNDWDEAITLENDVKSVEEKELLAWGYIGKGNALSIQSQLQDSDALFRQSFEQYKAALTINPQDADAFCNWGIGLAAFSRARKNDEALMAEAISKFKMALTFNPDLYVALQCWGAALATLANTKNNDEALLREAISKYAEALKVEPRLHDTLNNWGLALSDLAEAKNDDEILLREAVSKYQAALKVKPDSHSSLNNWGNALIKLYRKRRDAEMLTEAEDKLRRAEKISGRSNYNLACVFAFRGEEDNCRIQLLRCKADGTLPDVAHLAKDKDLQAYWARDWFKKLLV